MRFIDQYEAILLDLNGTFMFGQDRFGPDQDYYQTYVTLGGGTLSREMVTRLISRCHRELTRAYNDPTRYDDFPSHAEVLLDICRAPEQEVPLLENVLIAHELGSVPAAYVEGLSLLARSHELGIVSNIWGRPDPWISHLEAVGLKGLFKCTVFSSEGRSMKPSLALFRRALQAFPSSARVLFVGDSHAHDVVPAKALGLGAVWISIADQVSPVADVTLPSLLDLAHLER